MSDAQVRACLERMAGWLGDPSWVPDPEALDAWDREYRSALDTADHGPGWPELRAWSHELGARMEARIGPFEDQLREMRAELDRQSTGERALRGYQASTAPR